MGRAWRIIFSIVCILILLVNLSMFVTENQGFASSWWLTIHYYHPLGNTDFKFRGIEYFSRYIETFPALQNCQELVAKISTFINGDFHTSYGNVIDAINGVLMILASPVEIALAFLIDIYNNLVWIFGFFFPNWFSA